MFHGFSTSTEIDLIWERSPWFSPERRTSSNGQLSAFNQNDRPLRYLGKRSRRPDKRASGMLPGKVGSTVGGGAVVDSHGSPRHPIGTSMKFVDAPEEKRDCDALSRRATLGRSYRKNRADELQANTGIRVFMQTPRPDLKSTLRNNYN